jgi:alcohol dehydrogenase class IV
VNFEFCSPGRILFGAGAARDLGAAARGMGRKALIVTGRNKEKCRPGIESLERQAVAWSIFSVDGEPDLTAIERGVAHARAQSCDCVIAFGGGSAMDAGKAIAAMMTNPGELLDYVEVVGRGKALACKPAPCIAVPTTAGTGSEVTRNAVLTAAEQRVKVSLRSPWMIPPVAIVDPELTISLPPDVTAGTGLDALTQLIEPYVSHRANPMTDACCREGIHHAARSLRRAIEEGNDLEARTAMSLASLMGGLALANAGLGIVHGFAAPVGGTFAAPHGAVCAALLPHGMRANVRALQSRAPEGPGLHRYQDLAIWLTGDSAARAEEGADYVERLCREFGIPRLGSYGITNQHVPELVEKALSSSSLKGNPIPLTKDELADALTAAL